MALLSKGLIEALSRAGVGGYTCGADVVESLALWLKAQGLETTHPVLEAYFGIPYCALAPDAHLTDATLPDYEGWRLYYYVQLQCYVCVRPPCAAEKTAFCERYGEAALYITDETAMHEALLRGSLPQKQALQGGGRLYDVRELLGQGVAHIDGMIGRILFDAIKSEATDVHFYSLEGHFHIDFRIHGALTSYVTLPQCETVLLLNKLKLMAEMDIAEHRLPQDGHIAMALDGETIHLRVGTLPLLDGEKMVIRILPEKNRHANLEVDYRTDQQWENHDPLCLFTLACRSRKIGLYH